MSYFYVLLTILLTVYGQIVIKWQVVNAGIFPDDVPGKFLFLLRLLANPWVISAFLCAFFASVTWMAAMTKLELSHAYPFVALTFVFVIVLSGVLFQEPITLPKIIGLSLVVIGVVIGSQG